MGKGNHNILEQIKLLILLPILFVALDLIFISLFASIHPHLALKYFGSSNCESLSTLYLIEFPSCALYFLIKKLNDKKNFLALIIANTVFPIAILIIHESIDIYNPSNGWFGFAIAPIITTMTFLALSPISIFMLVAYLAIAIPKNIAIVCLLILTKKHFPKFDDEYSEQ